MSTTTDNLIGKAVEFGDSRPVVQALLARAGNTNDLLDRYWLNRAADHVRNQHKLIGQMARRLKRLSAA